MRGGQWRGVVHHRENPFSVAGVVLCHGRQKQVSGSEVLLGPFRASQIFSQPAQGEGQGLIRGFVLELICCRSTCEKKREGGGGGKGGERVGTDIRRGVGVEECEEHTSIVSESFVFAVVVVVVPNS